MAVLGSVRDFRLSHGVAAAMPARTMSEDNMAPIYHENGCAGQAAVRAAPPGARRG
jgi:hypothetical protein